MTTQLVIEINTAATNNIKSVYNSIYPSLCCKGYSFNADQKNNLVKYFSRYLPALKIGAGSSHLWISNMENERIAIIYFK